MKYENYKKGMARSGEYTPVNSQMKCEICGRTWDHMFPALLGSAESSPPAGELGVCGGALL